MKFNSSQRPGRAAPGEKLHKTLTHAVLQASNFKQFCHIVTAEVKHASGAEEVWLLQSRTDQNRPSVLYGPAQVKIPSQWPEGAIDWVLHHQDTLLLPSHPKKVILFTPALETPLAPHARQAELRKRLQLDQAWLGEKYSTGFLVLIPFESGAAFMLGMKVKMHTVLVLKFTAWANRILPAIAPLVQTVQIALGLSEQKHYLEYRLRQSNAVSDIAENMNATLELDILLRLILLEVTKSMQCQAGDIWLKAERQENLVFRTSLGLGKNLRGLLLSGEHSRMAMEQEETIWIEDVQTIKSGLMQSLADEGIHSLAVVPLKTKNKVIGIMHLFAKQKREYSLEDKVLLKILVNQAATAIDQAWLFEETKRRSQELLAMYEIAQLITEKTNLAQSLKNIVDRVGEALNVEKCWVMFHERVTETLVAHPAAMGLDDEQREKMQIFLQQPGIIAHVFKTGRPFFTNTAEQEAAPLTEFKQVFTLRTLMIVPLRSREETFGVFLAANKKDKGLFKGTDVRFFSTLASETAVVIENSILVDKLNRRYLSVLQVMTEMVDAREPYAPGHSLRVANYSVAMAESLQLPAEEVERIRMAGLLHDIGKITLRDTTWEADQPGKLPEKLRQHPEAGASFLQKVEFPFAIHDLILSHHEWVNGTGYPAGLSGEKIPLGAKMIAIADAFDHLTSILPPQKPLTPKLAAQQIAEQAGIQFDSALAELFQSLWQLFEQPIQEQQARVKKSR